MQRLNFPYGIFTFAFTRFIGRIAAREAVQRVATLQLLNDGRLGFTRRVFQQAVEVKFLMGVFDTFANA